MPRSCNLFRIASEATLQLGTSDPRRAQNEGVIPLVAPRIQQGGRLGVGSAPR